MVTVYQSANYATETLISFAHTVYCKRDPPCRFGGKVAKPPQGGFGLSHMANELYIFVDESGDFDFSSNGSRFFIMSAVVTEDPIQGVNSLLAWRHHILARGVAPNVRNPRDCTHLHCSEDAQYTRNGVFAIVSGLDIRVHSVVVQKNKTKPPIRAKDVFYGHAFKALVPHIIRRNGEYTGVHIFVSQIDLNSKRSAMIGSLKEVLKSAKGHPQPYRLYIHPNHSHHMLQVTDYACWAIARKWERGDERALSAIADKIVNEFDLFSRGVATYY